MTTIFRIVFNFLQLNCCLCLLIILGLTKITAQPLNNHLIFDGNDDYISLNNMDVSGNAFTLEALVNSSDLSNCQYRDCRIISKAVGLSTPDHYWMLSTNNSGANTVLRFRLKTNGTSTTLVATSGTLSENTWYHVAATYDGSMMRLFLDGVEVGNTAKTGTITTNPAVEAFIGANPPGAENPWKGGIDEVRIWNTARTQAQIQANANTELTGNETGLQAYYQFNEVSGQTINDEAGNNNTVLGSTSSSDTNDPTFATTNSTTTLNLKVFLEGAYGPTGMTDELLQKGIVPTGQPYNDSPWNYPGTEGTGWLPVDYPAGTVDWVLVSLRESLDPDTEVARAAAVLLEDGSISPIDINNLNRPVHVMIEHRNHLPIISDQPIPIVNNTISYDFTKVNSYAQTGSGQKQVGTEWMMFAGNGDQEGQNSCDINAVDRIFWQTFNGLFGVYNPGDYNLDGDINAADRIVLNVNNGIFTTIPKPTPPIDTLEILNCGITLTGATATFLFNDPFQTPTTIYDFFLGSTPGADDIYNNIGNGTFNGLSITVNNIPTDGRTIYKTWLIDRNGNGGFPNPITVACTVTAATIINNQCMTYAQIRAAGRAENCYNRDSPNAHLAEFLYMNPNVSHWTNDPVNEMICPVDAPEPGPSALQAPAPTGGNDAPMIEAFINNNSGAEIVGTGTYRFGSTIDINVPVKIWDMPSKLIGSIGLTYRVNAPNVEMYRSLIDAQNLPSAHSGWRLEPTADNFVLSTSGIENIHHKNNSNIDGILIVGASDFHITCNKFNNLLGDFAGSPVVRAIRSSVFNKVLPSPAGYIANNESENLQSSNGNAGGTGGGAAFFTIQGYTGSQGTVKILANRCVNAAKRLAKCQNPDVYIASNFWHWKDRQGPLGNRKMLSITNCQLNADRVTTINNRIKIEAEARYDALLQVRPQHNSYKYRDIHFDCNDIELIDVPPANYYAFGASFSNKDSNSPDNRNQLVNCSVKDNIIRGSGGTNYVFAFGAGYIDNASGLGIDLSGNTVTAPVQISIFRGSNAPLP